jgi:hypothetical protein
MTEPTILAAGEAVAAGGVVSVVNFEQFQHYKDRSPAWIKLHASVLDSYNFCRLTDAQKWHVVSLWILASKCDNAIPLDLPWIARKIAATESIDLQPLMDAGLITLERRKQDASVSQACRKRVPSTRREEKRREEKKECPQFVDAMRLYPKRPNANRQKARKAWEARVQAGEDPATMLDGVKRYAAFIAHHKTEPKFIKLPATFFGPDRPYLDDYSAPAVKGPRTRPGYWEQAS